MGGITCDVTGGELRHRLYGWIVIESKVKSKFKGLSDVYSCRKGSLTVEYRLSGDTYASK